MARLPVAGAVKTRLAKRVGALNAAMAYRVLLAASVRALARDRRWQLVLAVTPARTIHERYWTRLAPGCEVIAQWPGDLGQRMAHLLAKAGRAPAAVMGSDIIDVRACHVAAALKALRGKDSVLAPAEDGGFWLCATRGVTRRFPQRGAGPFLGIGWSQQDSYCQTANKLAGCGHRVGRGPMRRDFDE